MIDTLVKIFQYIIELFNRLFGGNGDEPEPPPKPEYGPLYWIIEDYGNQYPVYFPEVRTDNTLALWKVKSGIINHSIYLPTILKNGQISTNRQGGIIFGKAVPDVKVSEGMNLIGFKVILQAGIQANGGKAIELVDPKGSVIQFEVVEYLGEITPDGYLIDNR